MILGKGKSYAALEALILLFINKYNRFSIRDAGGS
jgi:hypothetical protein